MKKNNILLTALAVVLILSLSIGSALAYFTDWTEADGAEVVHDHRGAESGELGKAHRHQEYIR